MTKIFRKLRGQQIRNNRIGRYVLYAIGEIILVVIGILIAVQINDYNTYAKQRKEELRLLKKFEKDFLQDSITLGNLIKDEALVVNNIDSIFGILEKQDERELFKLASLMQVIPNSNIFYAKTGTFDESVSAGKMDVIVNDSLREHIFGYYSEVKVNLSDVVFDKYQTSEIVPAFMEIILQSRQAAGLVGLNNPNLNDLSIKSLYLDKRFNQILVWRKINAGFAIDTWKSYLNLSSQLKEELSKEIQDFPEDKFLF